MSPLRRGVPLALLVALAATVFRVAGAQEPAPAPTAERPAAVAEPSASAIARQIEQTAIRLREISAAAKPIAATAEIDRALAAMESELTSMRESLATTDVGRLSRRDVRDLRQEWVRDQRKIDDWIATLSRRSDDLDARTTTLKSLADSWTAIRDRPRADLPEPLRVRGRAVIADLDRTAETVRTRQAEVIGLLARAGDARVEIDEALARIDATRRDVGRRLLERNDPPIWALGADLTREPPLGDQFRSSIAHAWRSVSRFVSERSAALVAQIGLFLGLVVFLAVLRRQRTGSRRDDPAEVGSTRILRRPIASAALITLIVMLWTNPDAPGAFFDVVLLGLLVPLLRLLPRLVYRDLRAPLFGLTALWVTERLGQLITESSVVDRFLQLIVSSAALAGLAFTLRERGPLTVRLRGRWGTAARFVARLWAAGLASAIVANLLGAGALAEMLSAASLNGLYLALVLFAAVLTLDGLTHLAVGSPVARSLRFVRNRRAEVEEVLGRIYRFAAVALWTYAVLHLLRIWDPARPIAARALGYEIAFGSFTFTAGNIAVFAISVWAAVQLSRLLRFVLEEDVLARVDLPRGVPQTISMFVHYGVLVLGLFAGMAAAGFEITQFAIVVGALGVGVGFGLQNVVNNFVSGLILIFERPIKVGDIVEIGTVIGEVRGIGIRASTIRTYDGAEVVVPNGNLLSSELVNWTLSDRHRRIEIPVGVAYGSDPSRVLELLRETVAGRPEALQDPKPVVLFQGFGESSLDFSVRFWTADFDRWFTIRSEAVLAIHAALRDAEIEIPFPQRDLHVRSVPAAAWPAPREPRGGPDER